MGLATCGRYHYTGSPGRRKNGRTVTDKVHPKTNTRLNAAKEAISILTNIIDHQHRFFKMLGDLAYLLAGCFGIINLENNVSNCNCFTNALFTAARVVQDQNQKAL